MRLSDMVAPWWRRVKLWEKMQASGVRLSPASPSIPVARQAIGLKVAGSDPRASGGPERRVLKCRIIRRIIRKARKPRNG
jgi:hypothetical protein